MKFLILAICVGLPGLAISLSAKTETAAPEAAPAAVAEATAPNQYPACEIDCGKGVGFVIYETCGTTETTLENLDLLCWQC